MLSLLELKLPPLLLTALIAIVMWFTSPVLQWPSPLFFVGLFLIALGVGIMFFAAWQFRRTKTTLNPVHIDKASQLVDTGIFRYSRNPMYLGMASQLFGLACMLSSWASFIGPLFFLLYMTTFQILPEERMLTRLFGASYLTYMQRVRRWL